MGADGSGPIDAAHERLRLDEQIAYYRARAPEYEDWWDDHRADHPPTWAAEVAALESALASFAPTGTVLELACGTGLWTRQLVRYADRITAVDASPEVMALNAGRLPADVAVDFLQADLFAWRPEQRYDVVFFSFWLTHVPPAYFDAFWSSVAEALRPGGRFFMIDNRESYVDVADEPPEGFHAERRLRDGRRYTIVKEFYEPADLVERLAPLGWEVTADATGPSFVLAHGRRADPVG